MYHIIPRSLIQDLRPPRRQSTLGLRRPTRRLIASLASLHGTADSSVQFQPAREAFAASSPRSSGQPPFPATGGRSRNRRFPRGRRQRAQIAPILSPGQLAGTGCAVDRLGPVTVFFLRAGCQQPGEIVPSVGVLGIDGHGLVVVSDRLGVVALLLPCTTAIVQECGGPGLLVATTRAGLMANAWV